MTWYWLLATGTEGLQVLTGDAEASATEQRVVQAIHAIATAGEQGEATAGPAGRDGTRTKEGLGDWEPTGQNLPAIPRRIAEKIRRGQYVDFSALLPAAGLSKQPPPHLEGGLVVYKAEDLARSSKIIPDIATWHQCYYLWMTVALKADPSRLQELLSYGYLITKCSKAFKWPSWVMYDRRAGLVMHPAGGTRLTRACTRSYSVGGLRRVRTGVPIASQQTTAGEGVLSRGNQGECQGSWEQAYLE